jgi:hypothetical protein
MTRAPTSRSSRSPRPPPTASGPSEPHDAGDTSDAPAWLQPVYAARQARTVELVRRSVEALRASGRRVSLATIVAEARHLDPSGRGVSASAVLHNDAARTHYEQHRTWRAAGQAPGRRAPAAAPPRATHVGPSARRGECSEARVRRRYLRLRKAEVVARLVAAERASAEAHERWLAMNDEVLTWMLLVHWLLSAPPPPRGEPSARCPAGTAG